MNSRQAGGGGSRHAIVVAYLALFAALGGSAVAAGLAQKNSVVSKSIKQGAVRSGDVRDGGLSGTDLADGGVAGADVADDGLTGSDLDESTLGEVPSALSAQAADRATAAETAETALAVAPSSVSGAGIVDGSLTGADVDESTLGATTAGYQTVALATPSNSNSPKTLAPTCPPGKRYVFADYDISGGKTGDPPNQLTDVVLDEITPISDNRQIAFSAFEEDPHAGDWSLIAAVHCVNAP